MNTQNIGFVVAGVCGSLDERGLINGFDRKGFTYTRCGAELVANICDASATQAFIIVDRDAIRLIDNGVGMNEHGIQNMFATFRENHNNDNSMGVSGLGAKPSIYILSKKNENPTTVHMYTHMDGCGYIKACIPFERIKAEGRYTGMITYDVMNESEVSQFLAERQGIRAVGTTIKWVYSETTHQYFEKQFSPDCKKMDMNDRLDCIFGKTRLNIVYKDFETLDFIHLELYDYFSGERPDYYTGIKEDIIEHWIDSDNNDRFTWENGDKEYEFRIKAKGISTKPEEVKNKTGWKKEGFYLLKNAMRRDDRLFDEMNPTCSQKISKCEKTQKETKTNVYGKFSSSNPLSNYEEKFFGGTNEELKSNIGKLHIVRNTQLVACIEMVDGFKISSSRGNADANMKTILHKTELSYYTKSCQDNRMDIAVGIQENKNQHSGDLPKGLMRLITYIKTMRYSEIIVYFELKCKEELDRLNEIRRKADEEKRKEERRKQEEDEKKRKEEEEKRKVKQEEEEEKKRKFEEEKRKFEEEKRLVDEEKRKLKAEQLKAEQLKAEQLKAEQLKAEQLKAEQLKAEQLKAKEQEAEELEDLKAKTRKHKESVQTRITVQQGIRVLSKFREENDVSSEEMIDDMTIAYLDCCASTQVRSIIKYVPFNKKIDLLIELINKQYPYNKETDMKEGSRLYKFVCDSE
jgi:hypothetical protein